MVQFWVKHLNGTISGTSVPGVVTYRKKSVILCLTVTKANSERVETGVLLRAPEFVGILRHGDACFKRLERKFALHFGSQ